MRLTSFKAQSIGEQNVPNLTLVFDRPVPTTQTLAGQRGLFQTEARKLVGHLVASLPQGLIDHILAELMARRASLLVVPSRQETPQDEGDREGA